MIDDIANLYKQILDKEKSKEKESPVQEVKETTLNESVEEPFDSFLAKLGEKISEKLIEKNPQDERVADIVSATLPENSHKYIQELQKVDKPNPLNILSEEEKKINNIISEQIQEEIGKVKTQISRMAIEGGGGSVAVQYANGGTMRGDLNVIGRYLSGGVDLATLIGTGGGGVLSGTTDRLISGSQMLKLNSDGTINFPSNTISPQDNTILNLESKTTGSTDFNKIALSPYGFFAYDVNSNSITIDSNDNDVTISSQGLYDWKFNNKGQIEGPSGTLSVLGNLSASGRVYQNGNDLQSEIESISSFALSTKTTVQSNSASWNYQGTDIKALTAGWVGGNAAYTNLVANSAAYLSGSVTDLSFLSVSGNWNSTYTTVQQNSASWAIDSTTDTGVRALTSNWQNTFTTVQSNSSTWNYQGTDIKNLTAGWVGGNAAYTNLVANSAAYLSAAYVDLSFLSVSGNWNSVYSTVNSNSATTWNYQGSDLKALSSNWESTYTTVQQNSASWAIDSTTDTGVRALTSNWQSTYTTVLGNSATWNYQGTDIKNLTAGWVGGNEAYTNLVANSAAYLSAAYVDLSFLSVSGNWNSVYSTVNTNSATWNYQGTDIKSLTAGWVGGNDAYTNLVSNSAAYLSGVDLSFLSVSGNWNSAYTTVQNNSATTWNYQGSDIKAISGNWDSVYTTVLANSATWSSSLTGVAQTIVAQIVNADSVTMNRGDVVYSYGATGNVMSVKLASNSGEATSSKTFGIINGTIAPNQIGYVTFLGQVDKLNLEAFNEGDALYLGSTAGTFTNVKPVAPNHLVYIGVVERANNGNGIIYVRTQNGYEIEELHNVLITSVSAGQILRRNNTNNLWINTNDGSTWDSTHTTVNTNSATTWNYQGTDLKNLSSGWVGGNYAYTNLVANSAAYLSAVDLSFLSVSGNWNSTYTTVNANSAAWGAITSYSSLIGNNTTNPLTATHNLNTKDIVFSVREVATDKIVYAAGRTIDNNNIELSFNTTPSINQYDLTVLCNGGIAGIGGGTTNNFALVKVTTTNYIQNATYTHNLYDDTSAAGQITVTLLPPAYHVAVTQHKKIGSTANVVLSAPNGVTIDGQPTYTLTNQYESIGIYTDGTNYFIE